MTDTTTPTPLAVWDAITGEPVTARGHHRHVLFDAAGRETWLTPTAAVALADALRQAAATVLAADTEETTR